MQGNLFVMSLTVPGTLTADADMRFSFPFGVTLIGGNAGCDNTTSFLLNVGTAADADAYIDDLTVSGAAATTTDIAAGDLVDGAPMHIAAGTELVLAVDYDGGAGGDSANVDVHLFFREG
jgi:hypothetical protein